MVGTRRERYREETKDEAKRIALEQLAELGVGGISVNAIAKRMGVTGPALYRYFKNRDDLLTELIRDAWSDLADTVEAGATSSRSRPPRERVHGFGQAFREWALAQPHRYLLLFGTPLPGYHAPQDTIALAHRTTSAFISVLADVYADRPAAELSTLDGQLAAWTRSRGEGDLHPAVPLTALRAFTRLHGVLSLEVSGQFGPMGFDPALLYRAELESLIGVSDPGPD
ncbi:AcrR family transcriptional regulator [Saccharothrix tamanrassetensis]|uniref:AcrR family transcriptional regulator n=1 Tax=Saccharothrix tamanrassetensis TaxID=1051531 RepID=A0A841CFN0_9PSEU|nr:TetR/AcrR family transcriptional regulator [Saccharothrix tamanrassetensis]MBB5954988.1 AcrR family transcriptional regulator [Saccharothrix tamanrassetensis]